MRRLSGSFIGRRPSAVEELKPTEEIPQTRNSTREEKAPPATEVDKQGSGRKSHSIPYNDSIGIQLKTIKNIDSNYNAVVNEVNY